MRSTNRIRTVVASVVLGLIALLAMPSLAGAHGESDQGPKQSKKNQKVAIGFAALNGTKPVSCDKPIAGLGTTSRSAQLNDLRFYVTGAQLLRKGGGAANVKLPTGSKWSYTKGKSAVTLIDLENGTGSCAAEGSKETNSLLRGTVAKGKYVGIRYSISVPYPLNHTDLTTTPAPLNLTAMGWSWQGGRKYMKIELSEDGGEPWGSKIFFLHVGSTDCKGNPAAGETTKCALPNRNRVTLKKFNPAKQRIAIDLAKVFGGVDITGGAAEMGEMDETPDMGGMGDMGGCMSFIESADCAPIFKTLGMKIGTSKTTAQTAFRVVGK